MNDIDSGNSVAAPASEPAGKRVSRTLEKGLQLLDLFDVDHQEWTLRELREATGESKTTILRLTNTLVGLGYLARRPQSSKFRLGTSIVKLAYVTLSHGELVRVAEPFMRRLSEMTRETVDLTVEVDQDSVITLYAVTPRFLRPQIPIGRIGRAEMETATGKIFVAFRSEETWHMFLDFPVGFDAPRKMSDPRQLREQLIKARQQGVAYDFAVSNSEIVGMASPVFGADGTVKACLSVLTPVERFGPQQMAEYADALREVVAELSEKLGAPAERVDFLRKRSR